MAYSTTKNNMERCARMSSIEKRIRSTLEMGLFFGVELPLALIGGIRCTSRKEQCPNDDGYFTEVFPLDVPQNIPITSLDKALEDVGRGVDSEKKIRVEYSGLLYHLHLKHQTLAHPRGNLRGVYLPKDLTYFEHNHMHDYWVEPDGSLYVAIKVYSFPTLEDTKLPVPVKSFPFQSEKSYMGGLVDLIFFDPTIGEHLQVYLQPANTTLNRNLFWRHRDLVNSEDICVGDNVPYYAVATLREKHMPIANQVLSRLQNELCKLSK